MLPYGLGYRLNTEAAMPEGWLFVDELDLDYYWHWSDVGPRGTYTGWDDYDCHTPDSSMISAMPTDASTENGFLLFEADYFNSTEDCELSPVPQEHESAFIFGPIDFTEHDAITLNLKTYYRFCCNASASGIYVDFSTNYNSENLTGDWSGNIFINAATDMGSGYPNVENSDYHVDVTSFAANQNNVYVKIRFSNASHYFAIIDDIVFYEPYDYDLAMEDNWAYYLYDADDPEYTIFEPLHNSCGGYTVIPQELVGPFVKFKSAVKNIGKFEVSNARLLAEIYKDNTLIETFESEGQYIPKGEQDTLTIETNFVPDERGSYKIVYQVLTNEDDDNPEDNSWTYNFAVSTSTYSRVYHNQAANFENHSPRSFSNGGYDGDAMIQPFNIPEGKTAVLNGIRVYIDNYTDYDAEIAAIENGEFGMIAKVWQNVDGEFTEMNVSSDYYILQITDTASWVYLEFVNGNLVLQGSETEYLVGIEVYTGTDSDIENPTLRYLIGTDPTLKQPVFNGGVCYIASTESLAYNAGNYAIDLIIDTPCLDSLTVTFNYDVSCLYCLVEGTNPWFNPYSDTIYLTGTFTDWAVPGSENSLIMTDPDGDYTYTVKTQIPANTELEYKHFINSGWESSEWAGDPNRSAILFDFNLTVNDSLHYCGFYEDCYDIAINEETISFVNIYPNPFANELIIKGENLDKITILNLLGQTLKSIQGKSEVTINTTNLKKGIYIICISDSKGNTYTRKLMKE